MTNAAQFRNLLTMAAADGRMSEAEFRLLSDRAIQWGISDAQFEDALQEALTGTARLTIPRGMEERHALLKGLIRMMAADGKLSAEENKLFALAAATMRISTAELNGLIDSVLEEEGRCEQD